MSRESTVRSQKSEVSSRAADGVSAFALIQVLPAVLLLFFVLLLYYPLLFTNRVLANGDILHYFYPYRDYAASAFREGKIPLWNPYIFLGAPFLANPQTAVLYPLHWPLSWLPVTKQIYWSAALHTWILGLGGYQLMRRWQLSLFAGLTTAVVLAGSGFYGGLLGHINQMNAAAWLPWGMVVIEGMKGAGGGVLGVFLGFYWGGWGGAWGLWYVDLCYSPPATRHPPLASCFYGAVGGVDVAGRTYADRLYQSVWDWGLGLVTVVCDCPNRCRSTVEMAIRRSLLVDWDQCAAVGNLSTWLSLERRTGGGATLADTGTEWTWFAQRWPELWRGKQF